MAPEQRPDIEALTLAIANSPIVVASVVSQAASAETPRARLPAGFDDADLAILHWIAEEARRAGRRLYRN